MVLKTSRYSRRAFCVDAIRVTADNIHEVAEWCKGEVLYSVEKVENEGFIQETICVSIPSGLSVSAEKTRAWIGDWIVRFSRGYKKYTHQTFKRSFVPATSEPACGKRDFTVDHEPCVLGRGHLQVSGTISGCRSLQDYKILFPSPTE